MTFPSLIASFVCPYPSLRERKRRDLILTLRLSLSEQDLHDLGPNMNPQTSYLRRKRERSKYPKGFSIDSWKTHFLSDTFTAMMEREKKWILPSLLLPPSSSSYARVKRLCSVVTDPHLFPGAGDVERSRTMPGRVGNGVEEYNAHGQGRAQHHQQQQLIAERPPMLGRPRSVNSRCVQSRVGMMAQLNFSRSFDSRRGGHASSSAYSSIDQGGGYLSDNRNDVGYGRVVLMQGVGGGLANGYGQRAVR